MEAAEELHRKKLAQEREGEKDEEVDTKDDPMAKAEAEVLRQKSWKEKLPFSEVPLHNDILLLFPIVNSIHKV